MSENESIQYSLGYQDGFLDAKKQFEKVEPNKGDLISHRKATIDNAMRIFLERYAEVQKDKVIQKPISKALYDTWKYFDSIERERKGGAE